MGRLEEVLTLSMITIKGLLKAIASSGLYYTTDLLLETLDSFSVGEWGTHVYRQYTS